MNSGKTLFAQLMDFLPWSTFTRIVARYGGDQRVRTLSCGEHYRAMAFAQLTYRESLRDIETCLSVQVSKLYSMGFRDPVRRSTLADANEARDWRIYAELARRLIGQARRLYVNEDLGFDLANTVYALELDDHRSLLGGLSVGAFPHDQKPFQPFNYAFIGRISFAEAVFACGFIGKNKNITGFHFFSPRHSLYFLTLCRVNISPLKPVFAAVMPIYQGVIFLPKEMQNYNIRWQVERHRPTL